MSKASGLVMLQPSGMSVQSAAPQVNNIKQPGLQKIQFVAPGLHESEHVSLTDFVHSKMQKM